MTIQENLIGCLEKYGDNVAIEYAGAPITYHELKRSADRVTRDILDRGVKPGAVIGIRLTGLDEIITAVIGVMNARCVFVLLDSSLPKAVLDPMIANLSPEYIIETVAGKEGATVEVAYPEFDDEDSVYIYFTSGSSGSPKAIVGKNASLAHFLQWELETFKPDATCRFSQLVSPYFDAFLRDIFLPMLAGGTICIPPGGREFYEPETMTAWIEEHRINFIHCVPSVFRVFNHGSLTQDHFSHLRYVLMSGEKLVPAELRDWFSKFGSRIQLVNLYGSTEATMVQSCYLIQPEDAGRNVISIGDPIWDNTFVILNDHYKPCGPFVAGDLYVVSDFMSKGYMNNPALTRERFFPVDTAKGTRPAYRTGDKGRVLADGRVELMGRDDRQVKVRGIRVELDGIENVLYGSAPVRGVCVIKDQGPDSGESLLAFIVLNDGWGDDRRWMMEIQRYANEHLPEYMVPSKFVKMGAFPTLSNGKIDYRRLLEVDDPSDEVIAPGDEIEAGVLDIWKEILGPKPISVEDNFRKMGGNSLSIMKLIGRIYKKYNVRIALSDIFDNLTIRQQASIIRKSNNDYLFHIPKADKKGSYRVSAAQERMYYSQLLAKESVAYNLPIAWRMKEGLDVKRTEFALRQIISRHEALRTSFSIVDGELRQVVHDTIDFTLQEIRVPDEDFDETVLAHIRPFDLSHPPLMRATAISTNGGQCLVFVDFHHIICDGVSQMLLYADFLKLYDGIEPEPIGIQLKDYGEWEWSFRSTDEYLSYREFWLEQFEGDVPRIDLPIVQPGADIASDKGGSILFLLDKTEVSGFVDYLRDNELTNFCGFFCLYFIFLCQLTGQEDLVIGVATSGRMQEELERVVGMFVKTLPIRYKLNPRALLGDLLKDIGRRLIRANSTQIYDLSNIMSELNSKFGEKQKDLFDVFFVYFDFEGNRPMRTNLDFSMYRFDTGIAKYPLSLLIIDDGSEFEFKLEYSAACFTKTDAETLAEQLKRLILGVSKNLHTSVIDLIGSNENVAPMTEDDLSFNF